MNKSLIGKQDTTLVLNKSKSTLNITSKILSGKSTLSTKIIEDWIKELWEWADSNDIPDLEWVDDEENDEGGYFQGIPREKQRLIDLKYLRLFEKNLTDIPFSIGNLTNLNKISLLENNLTNLPESISHLNNLTDIHLHTNNFQTIPIQLFSLTKLQHLCINDNKLTEVPKEIGKLENLEDLYLYKNKLEKLPREIGKLTTLKTLYLHDNKLLELPDEIINLSNLTTFYFLENDNLKFTKEQRIWIIKLIEQGCEIDAHDAILRLLFIIWDWADIMDISSSKIPRTINKLWDLTILDFHNIGLDEFPKALCGLQKLTTLILWDNNLRELPEEIINFDQLQKINLRGNPLSLTKSQLDWLDRLRENGCTVYVDEGNHHGLEVVEDIDYGSLMEEYRTSSLEVVESFNLESTKKVYKISTDQNKVIEFKDQINAWIDKDTGLMWEVKTKENSKYLYIWSKEYFEITYYPESLKDSVKDAFSYAKKLNELSYAGYSDWRVPTRKELETLLVREKNNNSYIKLPLSKNSSSDSWSSTTTEFSKDMVYYVCFNIGDVCGGNKYNISRVRCVRAGQ